MVGLRFRPPVCCQPPVEGARTDIEIAFTNLGLHYNGPMEITSGEMFRKLGVDDQDRLQTWHQEAQQRLAKGQADSRAMAPITAIVEAANPSSRKRTAKEEGELTVHTEARQSASEDVEVEGDAKRKATKPKLA